MSETRLILVTTFAVIALLFVGCTTVALESVTIEKGGGLAVVAVHPPEIIAMLCQGAGASASGTAKIACVPIRTDTTGLSIFFRTPPSAWGVDQHELRLL